MKSIRLIAYEVATFFFFYQKSSVPYSKCEQYLCFFPLLATLGAFVREFIAIIQCSFKNDCDFEVQQTVETSFVLTARFLSTGL